MIPDRELSFQERLALARRGALKAVSVATRPARRVTDKTAGDAPKDVTEKWASQQAEKKLAEERRAQKQEQERKDKAARAADRNVLVAAAQAKKKRGAAANRKDAALAKRDLEIAGKSYKPHRRAEEKYFKTRPFTMEGKKSVLVDKTNNTSLIVDIDADEAELISGYQDRQTEKKLQLKRESMTVNLGMTEEKRSRRIHRDVVAIPKHAFKPTKNNYF